MWAKNGNTWWPDYCLICGTPGIFYGWCKECVHKVSKSCEQDCPSCDRQKYVKDSLSDGVCRMCISDELEAQELLRKEKL